MTSAALVARLASLPRETDASYGLQARALLQEPGATDDALSEVLTDMSQPEQVRFNAFYCLQARAWRRRDHRTHRANVDLYQSEFGTHPMFYFMQAEYYSSLDSEPANRHAALTFALEAVRRLSAIPGVLHLAASIIADHHEADADADPQLLLEGERLIRQAIALSHGTYPRYHATHARIATLRGAYGSARASIARAIEDEDSSGAEYALRIGDYQLIRARIQHAQQAEVLRVGQDEASSELRRIRAQILEIMGLLAAVIAFITTAANIAAGQPPGPAAGLLTTAGGMTLLVFWGFHVLVVDSGGRRRLLPLALGAILLGVGLVLAGR
ncbi:hypothetical protein [Parafrankia sp. EUN1f]|uniref:hypothetical protein n=1 Tax=Parafrankia sp. EUN1f TaxID=102897 RepID=UPI0001C4525F|nr:hypothetical protein [Parafrankia sp. EUN1f]EFC79148.1 hypothetical protein FrEUN1fDRAFT_7727 [Parafrankia sp. EUN1f]